MSSFHVDLWLMAARLAGVRLADLSPPLGEPGGPCQVVQRIEEAIRSPKLKDDLVKGVESNEPLSNKDVGKIYDVDVEPGVGTRKQIHISPHAQYRMDLRGVTVRDVQDAVKELFKRLNDWKSQKHPAYARLHGPLSRGEKVEWTSSKGITVVIVERDSSSLAVVTAYKEGIPDPVAKPGECGQTEMELVPPSRP